MGGKAANFGFLRRSLPHDSPTPVLAITFDLWEACISQRLPGRTISLRQFMAARLASHTFPPNVAALRADLAAIRDQIEHGADFTPSQRTAILGALMDAGLHGAKIRFRSSTNVEDGDTFSGAGLYDSYSGCLEDEIDGDSGGPSQCDPDEPKERGVFRAMRKVCASFYNENAFLERLRHGIEEDHVGMAILVHFSAPDPEELANGVATLAIEKGHEREAAARIVSQLGPVSVTNPDPVVRPEVVSATWNGAETTGATLTHVESSSLTENGETVMPWETDYRTLILQLNTAAQPELEGFPMAVVSVTRDRTTLVELAPDEEPWWPPRNYRVSKNGAQVNLHFQEGLPLYQGSPPFIFKTFILNRWLSPSTGDGGSLPAFSTDSWFARTLLPGHHNFTETVLLEPALDPALSETTRAALNAANIRYLYTFKDLDIGLSHDDIRFIGHDNTLRDP